MSKITISIGELVDKYTICKLKSERSKIDNSKEINEYLSEIQTYNEIQPYIDRLYEVNANVWDLEGDIRQGKELALGLEEVGRRFVALRDMNKVRIGIKNEINSKYMEGYIEVKVDHNSKTDPTLIISLSTVPERLSNPSEEGIMLVIKSLCEQEDDNYEIHFEVPPTYNPTGEPYIIPDWLNEYKLKYPHLRVFRPYDMGPATKFVPAVRRITNPDTILLVVDDDLIYHREMVTQHRRWQRLYPTCVIAYAGGGCRYPLYPYDHSLRDSWISCVIQVRETTSVQHYKSVSHKVRIFDDDFWNYYVGRTISDDALLSKYCLDKNVLMLIVPYEPENYLFETTELWSANNRVETFPCLRNAVSVGNSGGHHPEILKQPGGMPFFEPPSLGDRSWINGVSPVQIWHWTQESGYHRVIEVEKEPWSWNRERGFFRTTPVSVEEPVAPVIEEPVALVIEEPVIEDPVNDDTKEPINE